ncbi:hybrid histidine kinase/response regulator HrmK [Anabaena sp. FACHB-709]|uniref:Circadian input-output histidine kinase CikA n=2 Tax=Nostocaceae TaxID=1162 RepID=A0A1Z4KTF6_ANAVA|nr:MULTISPECIES: hybrid histidine kinase/response regulator HrmK [Nostocaceae]BAY72261.1 two-component hybrid sensor and regulator [Trichormus variabilis NIES-23]HBW29185.1 hybrid sensor histidine kinase/response regulator [Nostoc sp. UBA8866]MBD2170652.1 response regulator [Anabaena cylindrica FACHB-318]MBD2262439.1 response regulator [Anabaena sp. FACHB-709]MBD2271986.1 response regulator [Nostoc sp. PCC 7120 = FACHB-418]
MQQYSSLPEHNSSIDTTPTLLAESQQLCAELWLERSLNQLQTRLHNCLESAFNTVATRTTEADIFQTVVNELDIALNSSNVGFPLCAVGIALLQPQAAVGKVYYISRPLSLGCQPPLLEERCKDGKKLRLQLQEAIKITDLQKLENQQPPRAWQLRDDFDGVIGWLLLATDNLKPHENTFTAPHPQLNTQLMERSAEQCVKALVHLKKIQSLQQKSQNLGISNQELERTNQLKNQFLANTSHEIRTPLSSIIGFTHLLLAQGYDPTRERHHEYLNIIQSSGKHLLALINDILDLSKIEANQLEVQWEKVNVPELCQNVLTLIKEKAANKGVKLSLELDPNIKTFVADPLRLKQMLLNLLFNALKFTNQGTVGLKVTQQDSFIHFTVWDTGSGISPENLALLFQPYFQIPNSSVAQHEGTGLGLVVTRKLAEIHNGSVEVESQVAHGSRFTIILPLQQNEQVLVGEDVEDEETKSAASLTPNSSKEILLVEDDLPNGELMQTHLSKLGYNVTWVKNAHEMWAKLDEQQAAVILMDVRLPDGDGLDLVKQLREKSQYQQIPIIAQTAMAMKGDRAVCLSAGVNDYISKPIDLNLLASLVAKYSQL